MKKAKKSVAQMFADLPADAHEQIISSAIVSAVERGSPLLDRMKSQAYAMRVWSGQSPDVPRAERIARCIRALEGQNLPTEGVEFP